ncbi:hypothetical protein FOA52_000496 [Chlamydomonas sp. UWO 241]|nr:hypothetical protein FOA52_000496 [Chlamydomonas sp. UWO 241]
MSPTLNPGSISGSESKQCDWILVEKLSYKLWHSYQRGDVATLWCPENPRIQITKRLVAIEGDTVWDDAKGRPEKLLPGRCWIEGDNARLSGDSRNMFGPVHMGLLQGRAVAVVWPLWRCGWLERVEKKGRIVSRAPPTDS